MAGRVVFTAHARHVAHARQISHDWIFAALDAPQWQEPDPRDAGLTRAFRAIAERDNRVLRVIYRRSGDDFIIVSAFFDRGARRP